MKISAFFALSITTSLMALPSGGQVLQGEAAVLASPDALQVHASGKAILHWDQFDIASGEAVHFLQSEKTQAILNRVMQGEASQILGFLQANCPVYLINPQGVFIGNDACIDTAGFLASTANISDCVFWQGELQFQNLGEGRIVNLGRIDSSGDVHLIARAIDNQGRIEASYGSVLLTTQEIMLRPDTKQCVFIRTDGGEKGIDNSGTIRALSVELRTCSPYEKAIHHQGLIEACRTVSSDGRIYLVADRGGCVLDALLTAAGGVIDVAAEAVYLTSGAVLDASSETRGGDIRIGPSAREIHVEKGAKLLAGANRKGNGGTIELVAEHELAFHGLAASCGGKEGGDGGNIHLSSKGPLFHFDDAPIVRASAPKGSSGTVLFDPKFVTISSGGTDPATGNTFASNPSGSVIISGMDLQTALDAANVIIQANTDILFQDTVAASTMGNSLTLQAGRSIQMGGSLTLTAGDFNATINDSGAMSDRDAGVAIFTLSSGAIATQGGDVSIDVGMFGGSQQGEANISGSIDAGGGDIDITGFARQDGSNSAYGILITGDAVLQTAGMGTLSLQGTGGNGANYNVGVYLGGGVLQTDSGLLQITGQGGGNGLGNGATGIFLAAQVSAGSGSVLFQGTGGTGVHGNMGVYLGAGQISTVDGDITLQGTGAGTGALNFGVRLDSGAACASSGSGAISLTGITSPSGRNNNHGVSLAGGSLTANTGLIAITGTGRGSVNYNYGIRLESDSQCISTGTAPITLNGQNTAGVTGNAGVSISTLGVAITSVSGDVEISGTSSGTGSLNQGVRLESGQISSTGMGMGAAEIHLTGVGSMGTTLCNGVAVQGVGGEVIDEMTGLGTSEFFGTVISSIDGNITLEGTAQGTSSSQPLDIDPNSLIQTTGSGMIIYIEH